MNKRDKTITFKGKGNLFIPRNIIRSEYPEAKDNGGDKGESDDKSKTFVSAYDFLRTFYTVCPDILAYYDDTNNQTKYMFLKELDIDSFRDIVSKYRKEEDSGVWFLFENQLPYDNNPQWGFEYQHFGWYNYGLNAEEEVNGKTYYSYDMGN